MSTEALGLPVPEFDLADRMRKALRTSGLSVQQMADYLDVVSDRDQVEAIRRLNWSNAA